VVEDVCKMQAVGLAVLVERAAGVNEWIGAADAGASVAEKEEVHISLLILPMLPEFGVEEAEDARMVVEAEEAGAGEGGVDVGEMRGAEAGEDAEGEVECADVKRGDGLEEGVLGDGEVGEQPERARGGLGGEAGG